MSNHVKNSKRFTPAAAKRATPTVTKRVVAFFWDPRKRSHVSQFASGVICVHGF